MPKSSNIRERVEEWFSTFEEVYTPDERESILIWLLNDINESKELDSDDKKSIQKKFCAIFEYYSLPSSNDVCTLQSDNIQKNYEKGMTEAGKSEGWMPTWLKIVLFILVGGLLAMWGIILFFSIKAKLSSSEEDEW